MVLLVWAYLLCALPETDYARTFAAVCALKECGSMIDIDEARNVRDQILVADSLVTLDPFPYYWDAGAWQMYYDEYEGQPEISIYRAIFLRPIRTIGSQALKNFRRPQHPRGILFFSRPENGVIIAELFPYQDGVSSYEEYYTSVPSLKILVTVNAEGKPAGTRCVRLLR